METSAALTVVPSRPDKEVAEDLKRRFREAMAAPLAIMDEMRASGFVPNFNVTVDYLGQSCLGDLTLLRHF